MGFIKWLRKLGLVPYPSESRSAPPKYDRTLPPPAVHPNTGPGPGPGPDPPRPDPISQRPLLLATSPFKNYNYDFRKGGPQVANNGTIILLDTKSQEILRLGAGEFASFDNLALTVHAWSQFNLYASEELKAICISIFRLNFECYEAYLRDIFFCRERFDLIVWRDLAFLGQEITLCNSSSINCKLVGIRQNSLVCQTSDMTFSIPRTDLFQLNGRRQTPEELFSLKEQTHMADTKLR